MQKPQGDLKRRLQALAEEARYRDHPLMGEVRFFAERAIRLEHTLEKLTRISDTMQAQIMEQSQELARVARQKDHFFAIIAHDLRGPLHTFVEIARLLQRSEGDSARDGELVDTLVSTGMLITDLAENLLRWARLQMDAVEVCPEPLKMAVLFHDVEALTGPKASAKGQRLQFEPTGVEVFSDFNMLFSVLRNLVDNAIKFTPEGGVIRVGIRDYGAAMELWVADDGPGIGEELIDHLFDVDNKTSTVGTAGERGSGLGLPLCAEMLARLKGSIRVQSAPGVGSTFIATIPELGRANSDEGSG